MTQTEIEAEVTNLRARVSQYEQQQEIKKKEWVKLGLVAWSGAFLLIVNAIVFGSIDLLYDHNLGPAALSSMYALAPIALLIRVVNLLVAKTV